MSTRLRYALALLLVLDSTSAVGQEPAPPRIETVVESVNGVEIRDPYRWMEQSRPEFDTWAKAEAINARSVLRSIPNRDAIRARIASLDTPGGGIGRLQARNGRWLYRQAKGDGKTQLFTREGENGNEQLVDLLGSLPAAGGPWSEIVPALQLSPDGRHLLFGTTQKGESNPTLRVYDLQARRLLPDTIEWPLWADANGFVPRWLADGSGFLYVRRPDANAAMDNTARARRGQIFQHRLGTPVAADRALFGFGLTPEIVEADTLYVEGEPHPRWLAVYRREPEGREVWVVDLPTATGTAPPAARRIWASDVATPGYGVLGDWLYVADSVDNPRYRIVRYDLRQARPMPEVVLPQQEGVVSQLVASGDAVYVVETLLNRSRLHVVPMQGEPRTLELAGGAIDRLTIGPEGQGAWISQVDWLVPRHDGLLAPGASHPRTVGPETVVPAALSGYATTLEWATARDGERIPYTIVRRARASNDGNGYVMLDGYGCFGSADPQFYWPSLAAWLERGGVFVHAGMRGGGELGADWHRAGRDRNKPAAYEDAIDVAKHLIRTGVTRPGRIGVTGGSCGGMTMGMAALEAPHLIAAAVLSVGAFDAWRMAGQTAAGARSIRDIGDPGTAEGTRRILALSPYMQLLDGAPRPALLIDSGATDYTIPLWVAGKMVARSRAALPDGKPVLWNIEWEAGHNVGADYVELDTDQFAFLFWQLGHPQFQPESVK